MESIGVEEVYKVISKTPSRVISSASVYLLLMMLKSTFLYLFSSPVVTPVFLIFSLLAYSTIYVSCGMLADNSRRAFFTVHVVLSSLIFVDMNYYAYYGFLPSVRDLALLNQVGAVKESFFGAFRPLSFLILADIPVLIVLGRQKKPAQNRRVIPVVMTRSIRPVVFVLIAVLIFPIFAVSVNMDYVYSRFGTLAYHFSDLYDSVFNKPVVDPEHARPGDYVNEIEEEGRHFGIASSRNIIVIQLESFQNFLVGAEYNGVEITPNLNKLVQNDSIYFSRYFQQVGIGNTSDAEFIIHNSMHSLGRISVYRRFSDGTFYTLPGVLKQNGYNTSVFHGNVPDFWNREVMYESQGIDEFYSLDRLDPDEIIAIGLSDRSLFKQAAEIISRMEEPFYSLIITLTSHVPYTLPGELKYLEISEELGGTQFGRYLQAVHYTDRTLGEFIELLKMEDLYDDSLIVLLGDHAGLYPQNEGNERIVSSFLGRHYTIEEAMQIPLVFHIPGSGLCEEVETVAGQIDFFPTLLNLLGIIETSGILFGRDMINAEKGFVALQHVVPLGSFVDDEKFFLMSRDGVFENSVAWDTKTLEPVDIQECINGYYTAIEQIRRSQQIVSNDLLEDFIAEESGSFGAE
ncbi:MAG TPA: LTA synthase family protein [Kosmotogaceae bacterium]|nr:LTA synthase family protein [Kosmotogaceae bacterium]